jgi:hypothetical protein
MGVELESLITEVKDILPHLGDGFVEVKLFSVACCVLYFLAHVLPYSGRT